jgi:hypothetical protein
MVNRGAVRRQIGFDIFFDEGDDLHPSAASRTGQRVNFIYATSLYGWIKIERTCPALGIRHLG